MGAPVNSSFSIMPVITSRVSKRRRNSVPQVGWTLLPFQIMRRQVGGVGVHLVAVPWLARTAAAATTMGDAAIAIGRQVDHLTFPCVGVEGPAVAKHHWLSCAPVFVINLRTVFRRNCAHRLSPFFITGTDGQFRYLAEAGFMGFALGFLNLGIAIMYSGRTPEGVPDAITASANIFCNRAASCAPTQKIQRQSDRDRDSQEP